jgi:hypothetical protein
VTATTTRRVRDLVVGDHVASGDGSRVWTVTAAAPAPPRYFLWSVTLESEGREPYRADFHPDEFAPRPGEHAPGIRGAQA